MLGNLYGVTHGMSKTLEYRSWKGVLERCRNSSSPHYANYGARGISICERWISSFPNFIEDMGLRPTPGHSIDRINVDGNYEPGNCRWATRSEQQRNKRPMAKKTHCKRGHEFAVHGTYAVGRDRKGRTCIPCAKDRARAHEKAKLFKYLNTV